MAKRGGDKTWTVHSRRRRRHSSGGSSRTHLESHLEEARVGSKYQAEIDELKSTDAASDSSYADRDECLWHPSSRVSDAELDEFLRSTKSHGGMNEDAALHILYRNGYSTDTAIEKVKRLVKQKPSSLDREFLKSAFQQCNNRFDLKRMKLMLPHHSTRKIVDMYCLTKGLAPDSLYTIDVVDWNTKKKCELGQLEQTGVMQQFYDAKHRRMDAAADARRLRSNNEAAKKHRQNTGVSLRRRKSSSTTAESSLLRKRRNILPVISTRRSARLHPYAVEEIANEKHSVGDIHSNCDHQLSKQLDQPQKDQQAINFKSLLFMFYDVADSYVEVLDLKRNPAYYDGRYGKFSPDSSCVL